MAGRYRRPTTPEQREKATRAREAKLATAHQTLTEQVTALANGPQWRAWLAVAARFHHYSFNNTVLLLAQKPDATQVAGYTLWQQLGRQVGKGEKGLVVLAPVTRRLNNETTDDKRQAGDSGSGSLVPGPAGGDPADAGPRRVVGFRPAHVWDVSQTTGEPLPEPPMPLLLAGQAPDGLWDALAAQCSAAGFTVERRPIAGDDGPNGHTTYATRRVVVRSDVDDAQAVKTLAHELGHVLMHDPTSFPAGGTAGCRGAREVEAESVAYLVAAEHGLDTSGYTFAYLAAWATEAGDVAATLRTTGTRVLAAAHQILDATHDRAGEAVKRVPVDGDSLAARAMVGAARTGALRDTATAPVSEPNGPGRERLVAANAAAAEFFFARYPESWAPAYLEQRIGTAMLQDRSGRVGYAPAGWTRLADELRGQGFADEEILTSGLGLRASTGRIVDRFRDRLMFPIRQRTAEGVDVVGFIGRRNPAHDKAADARNPKYLNTPQTSLYMKGEHLFGLAENTSLLRHGGLAVLVEGPVDALAVDYAAQGTMAGLAPLGTAITDGQVAQIRVLLGAESDRVVVAADNDPAGQKAARSAYQLLTTHRLDPCSATLVPGLDPAQTVELHGPVALVDRLATAQPMARQLVEQALAGADLTWVEQQVAAARLASSIIAMAPPDTWEREIDAVATATGIDEKLLHSSLIETVGTDTDAPGRPAGMAECGQQPTPAELAAVSICRTSSGGLSRQRTLERLPRPVAGAQTRNYRGVAI